MPLSEFRRVAENILADRYGADYYRDLNLLTNYLAASFDVEPGQARSAAEAIHNDRAGGNFFQNPQALSEFLASRFQTVTEGEH